jgi:uncharacterized membrane protein
MANTTTTTEQGREREWNQPGQRPAKTSGSTTAPARSATPMRATQQRRARRPGGPTGAQSINEQQLARGLGWFSIGLGLTELIAPRSLSRLIGIRTNQNLRLRLLGLRELTSGVGILSSLRSGERPSGWLWSRVGGDAMDLGLLGAAFTTPLAQPGRLVLATAAVAGVTALDVICAQEMSRKHSRQTASGALRAQQSLIINRAPEELYQFWRNLQQLPRFMFHLESVQELGENRSRWVAKGPVGSRVEWEAEITEERPNERLAWRSLPGADVPNSGSVHFERAPAERGTIVTVELEYSPPAGVIGANLAQLFGREPEQQLKEDLRRFKQIIETGEIITTAGQPAGRPHSLSSKYDQTVRPQDATQEPLRSRGATSR